MLLHVVAHYVVGHAAYLTDTMVDGGAPPTTVPAEFPKPDGLKAMLETDIERELRDSKRYAAHAALAEACGEIDLRFKLEALAADEAGHARQMARLARGM